MVRKRNAPPKTGIEYLKSLNYDKYLNKLGVGRQQHYFWKQMGKSLLYVYSIAGLVWLFNETSPLGWWNMRPWSREDKKLAHLYERRKFPYPGDMEEMEEFVAQGGTLGTAIGPKGFIEMDRDGVNYQKELQTKKFEQEAQKLWIRMRNDVVQELIQKGYELD